VVSIKLPEGIDEIDDKAAVHNYELMDSYE
jgi:hypothetical protein